MPPAQDRQYAAVRVIARSTRPFDDVCANLERLVGRAALETLSAGASKQDIEDSVARTVGPSGLLIFQVLEHGRLLSTLGLRSLNARLYVIGNPLLAAQMTKDCPAAGLYVPLRLFVSEENGQTVATYDRPSASLSQFGNTRITEIGLMLDAKIAGLVGEILGA